MPCIMVITCHIPQVTSDNTIDSIPAVVLPR